MIGWLTRALGRRRSPTPAEPPLSLPKAARIAELTRREPWDDTPGNDPHDVPRTTRRLLLMRARYVLGTADVTRAAAAAADAIADGSDDPDLIALASLYPDAPSELVPGLLDAALARLRFRTEAISRAEATMFCARALADHVIAGTMGPWALARWAHSVIGWPEEEHLDRLVTLHWEYDDWATGYGLEPDGFRAVREFLDATADPSVEWALT